MTESCIKQMRILRYLLHVQPQTFKIRFLNIFQWVLFDSNTCTKGSRDSNKKCQVCSAQF